MRYLVQITRHGSPNPDLPEVCLAADNRGAALAAALKRLRLPLDVDGFALAHVGNTASSYATGYRSWSAEVIEAR